MLTIRKASERGASQLSWLDSKHSFSFGGYMDPRHMGFSDLRVINEDHITPGAGFGTHGHRDMEIVTYVLEGELAHKDSMGNGSVIRPGDLQRMTAGTGVTHSEINDSQHNPVHLLQIWLLPETKGLTPGYEQKHFDLAERQNQWRLMGSRDGREGSVTIHQDVSLYTATLNADTELNYDLATGRRGWLQVVRGVVSLNGEAMAAGDGAAVADLEALTVVSHQDDAEVLLFDLAA
ncbi:MAG: Pirin-related protein [Phormidesmis priestleyi Ana]|uniref:Pirin-related protein n=1 Tax=Phormidesmis priestleyi Ana TaxID=1666911 RepID=A0A0P7ZQW2_9CYAN|nr:MAG: Pirin-related protein [Phormidesmis priestleyi Ana]